MQKKIFPRSDDGKTISACSVKNTYSRPCLGQVGFWCRRTDKVLYMGFCKLHSVEDAEQTKDSWWDTYQYFLN